MQLFSTNNNIDSLLLVISDDVFYFIIFTNAIGFFINLEDIFECPVYIECKCITVAELKDDTHLTVLPKIDPASLYTNAKHWSIKFQYFSPSLYF